MNGLRSNGQYSGLRSAPSPTPKCMPSKALPASISRSSVIGSTPSFSAIGTAVSCARCIGETSTRGDVDAGQVLGGPARVLASGVREPVAGQAAVEDALGVVDLAVADQVDRRAQRAHGAVAAAAARAAPGSASAITENASSSSAAEMKHASNTLGGQYTPASSRAWKNGGKRQVSAAFMSS